MQEKESKTILLEKPTKQVKTEVKEDAIQSKQNLQELKKEKLFTSTVIETPNYDFIEASNIEPKQKPQTKSKPDQKFRFRLITIVYCVIVAICGAWIISNAVELNGISTSISQSNNAYMVNEAKYILKISELDAVKPDEDGSISPIAPENIFGVQAEKLAEPTDPTISTSWFDKFCNLLSGIFGG